MVADADRTEPDRPGPDPLDLDHLAAYDDGEHYVIRDEDDPHAWMRADCVQDLRP